MATPADMSERELRAALRRLMVETTPSMSQAELARLYAKYTEPTLPPTAAVRGRVGAQANAGNPSTPQQSYPRYVNGKYVKPPSGLILGLQPWQAALVAALAIGWVMGPPNSRGGGESDPLGLSGHDWAYTAEDHAPGTVLDVRRHEQLLGALEYHRDVTNLPVVVDVYSRTCGPCRAIAPAFNELAAQRAGQAVFVKVDASALQRTAMMLNARALPTFTFFHEGKMVHSFAGADMNQLTQTVDELAKVASDQGTFESSAQYPLLDTVRAAVNSATPAGDTDTADDTNAREAAITKKATDLHEQHSGKPARLMRFLRNNLDAATVEVSDVTPLPPDASTDGPGNSPASTSDTATPRSDDDNALATLPFLDQHSLRVQSGARASEPESVVIVGGGPAGLSAAIYAARAGLRPLVVAPEEGGQLLGKGVGVENFPGIFGGGSADAIASGKQVVEVMRQQALTFGTEFLRGVVVEPVLDSDPKRLVVTVTDHMMQQANVTLHARAVILAMGSRSRWLNVPGEELLKGHGVSTCATCDGYLYRDKTVAVVGGGDSAMESALVLARTAKSVIVIHRKDTFGSASKILADQVKSHSAISIKWRSEVRKFVGSPDQGGLTAVEVWNAETDTTEEVPVSACFVAIGHDPNTDVLNGQVPLDAHKYVVLNNPPRTTVAVPGVFVAGDVADSNYRQAVTSAGTGAAAALDAERWLSETSV
eukprot:m.178952 g.178952  ORF g.178952 m.178952 type:complete len:710 (+) comp14657_c0_seq1:40-2169(+)